MHACADKNPGVHSAALLCSRATGAVAAYDFALMVLLILSLVGSVRETAALVLRQLMPGLLGLSESGGNAAASAAQDALAPQRTPAAVRAEIVAFAKASLECALYTACSLATHACTTMDCCMRDGQPGQCVGQCQPLHNAGTTDMQLGSDSGRATCG